MLDVAASADAILTREPEQTRNQMARILGLDWDDARAWLLTIIGCHDLGKACPGFQCKWPEAPASGLPIPKVPNTAINHAFVSQIALTELLQESGWPAELAGHVADAVGCHHGNRATPTELYRLSGDRNALGREDWKQVRSELLEALLSVFGPGKIPEKPYLSGPDFMLLSGLTSFADWIGSNEEWFSFEQPDKDVDLSQWFRARKILAERALDRIGWHDRTPLSSEAVSFTRVFGFPPRPLQQAIADALNALKGPAILLVEAPMGEGKTEAAFFAHLELQRKFGHRGMYVALPTKATGNAMFMRTLAFLNSRSAGRKLDLQLLHGAALLNDAFQDLRLSGIYDSASGGQIRAGEWFTHKKRALLSEYGVGTVDQALLPILPVRHNFVRLWGMANRVVVFDEIHAYDAYTGTLLVHLLRWLMALGASVVLLSATLPPAVRRKLAHMVGSVLPASDTQYPRLSILQQGAAEQIHFEADPNRRRTLRLSGISPEPQEIRSGLAKHMANGGLGLALVNTVQRAQELYALFSEGEPLFRNGQRTGKRLSDGTEVYLFHARYPAERRQQREENALALFGRDSTRAGRKILIATQVAEQSLDLDFDVIVSDLAPIDLLLQRAGRLWRHARGKRPLSEPVFIIAGLSGDKPPAFGKPLWWNAVYREDLLVRTWSLLRERVQLTLPDEIDDLVQTVYDEHGVVSESIQDWLDKAMIDAEGKAYAQKIQANQAIIGFPDDASWDDPARFVLFDEDEPGVHRMLLAKTRLGEASVLVVPLQAQNRPLIETPPTFAQAKQWYQSSVSLSRKGVVQKFQKLGVPQTWQQSSILRNCYPMFMDLNGRWIEDGCIRLDQELGVVYEAKEAE